MTAEIPVLGKPTPQQRQAFKDAKAALGITEPMQFVGAEPGCGRLISFEEVPDFFADYALMRTDRIQAAIDVLKWVRGGFDDRAHSGVDFLNRIFGGGVREAGP